MMNNMSKQSFYKFIEEYIIEEYSLEKMDVELFVKDFREEIEDFVKEKEARNNIRRFI